MSIEHVNDWYKEAHEALEMLAKAEARIAELEVENERLTALLKESVGTEFDWTQPRQGD